MTFRQRVGLLYCRIVVLLGWPRRHVQTAKVLIGLEAVLKSTNEWIHAVEQQHQRSK